MRFNAIDCESMTGQHLDELVEQANEASDGRGGAFGAICVIDTEADEGEGAVIAFFPGNGSGDGESLRLARLVAEGLNR